MSVVQPTLGGQGGQGGGSQQGVFDQPGHMGQQSQQGGTTSHGLGLTQKQGTQGQQMQGQQMQGGQTGMGLGQQDFQSHYQGGTASQDDQGMYTQRGGWMQSQGGQGRQQGQSQGQGQNLEFQSQGAVYRGNEWKTMEHEEEPIIVHAPSGPMPGKPRNQAQNRSQEERERARRFGFPPTRLLVLTDGSENSHRALEAALHFRRRNDSLFIVNAVQLMDDTVEYDQTNRLLKDKGRKILDEVTKLIHEREIGRWECACLPSKNAKEVVLDYAQKHNIELIFIGSRGIDTKTGDFYPGSFSKYVINNSHCSVMLVR